MTGRIHELKCWPSEFAAIASGAKRFEYRRNDRDFARGDTLLLQLWDPHAWPEGITKGGFLDKNGTRAMEPGDIHTLRARVTHMLQGRFGVPEHYCVMSIELLPAEEPDHA